MASKAVTVVWRAFSQSGLDPKFDPASSRTIAVETDLGDLELCEALYAQTNLYAGELWDALQPLPPRRTHTALSVIFDVGDYVTIDGRTYEVASLGFTDLGNLA